MGSTEHYIIIFDFNVWFGPDLFEKYDTMFQFEQNVTSRIGVLDKNDFDNLRWFDIDPCIAFHIGNAWEEEDGDIIRIIAGRQATFEFDQILHFGEVLEDGRTDPSKLYEWTLDLRTGFVEERMISADVGSWKCRKCIHCLQGERVNI